MPPFRYLAEKLSDFKAELAATRDDLSLRTRQLNETAEHAAVTAERLRTADEAHSREVAALQVGVGAAGRKNVGGGRAGV